MSYQMIKEKSGSKYDPRDLFLDGYDYTVRSENEEESTDVPPMPPLEGDEEEVKGRKGLKILTPNKLRSRSPIFFAQI